MALQTSALLPSHASNAPEAQSTDTHIFGVPPTTPSTSQKRCDGSVQIPLLHVLAEFDFVHAPAANPIAATNNTPGIHLIAGC